MKHLAFFHVKEHLAGQAYWEKHFWRAVILGFLDLVSPMLLALLFFAGFMRYVPQDKVYLMSAGAGYLLGCYFFARIILSMVMALFITDDPEVIKPAAAPAEPAMVDGDNLSSPGA